MPWLRRKPCTTGHPPSHASIDVVLPGNKATRVHQVASPPTSSHCLCSHSLPASHPAHRAVMAELFAKKTGVCRGQGGSMHMFSDKHNFLGGFAFIGEGIPIGLGAAFQSKYRREVYGDDKVCSVWACVHVCFCVRALHVYAHARACCMPVCVHCQDMVIELFCALYVSGTDSRGMHCFAGRLCDMLLLW